MTTPVNTNRVYPAAGGCTVQKMVIGHAYPKNGNFHNPTPRVVWICYDPNGKNIGSACSKKGAKEIADFFAEKDQTGSCPECGKVTTETSANEAIFPYCSDPCIDAACSRSG